MDAGTRKMPIRPIVVDLDGTLARTDMLFECLILLLKRRPWDLWKTVLWALRGKAYLKAKLVDLLLPDVKSVPLNGDLVDWLEKKKSAGTPLVLATASDQRIADRIAERLPIFDRVMGTKDVNLSSNNKAKELVKVFGVRGYEYVGNSSSDFAVWDDAALCHAVNASPGVLRRLKSKFPVGEVFQDKRNLIKVLVKELRIHQWVKNLLIFVPLLAAHRLGSLPLLLLGVLAFLAFGACSSSVYLLNDLLDLESDREHPIKKERPLASGALSIPTALFLIPLLLIGSFGIAITFLPIGFTIWLALYFAITITYSFSLKGIALVDVVTLSFLYTLRVLAGTAVFGLGPTFWLLTFCLFIFLSLAFVKRYAEVRRSRVSGTQTKILGRGYVAGDYELLASLGSSAGYLSVLVFSLYINDAGTQSLYKTPQLLWLVSLLLLFWISRVWLVAHRGNMDDDPILFSIKDRASLIVGLLFFAVFVCASLFAFP